MYLAGQRVVDRDLEACEERQARLGLDEYFTTNALEDPTREYFGCVINERRSKTP